MLFNFAFHVSILFPYCYSFSLLLLLLLSNSTARAHKAPRRSTLSAVSVTGNGERSNGNHNVVLSFVLIITGGHRKGSARKRFRLSARIAVHSADKTVSMETLHN